MLDLTRQTRTTARINDRSVTVEPRETLLQAALREGLDFPNSCRVGGCGACKCRLTEGSVRELTETGYLLTAEELDQGYILACQSTPRTDVAIAVELPESVAGTVVAQSKRTHDITELAVQLDRPLAYRAGQFANVTLEGLDDVRRSYSFATPSDTDGVVRFFIRHVPGGRFSGLVHAEDVVGRAVQVEGPSGAFWLRPDDAPLVFVAGGSGLAPILAILEDAAATGVDRPATVLFGARQQRDLYALDELADLQRRWNGRLEVVPVLSDAADDAAWEGARGLVTEHIDAYLARGSHAYLCGPPAMVDAARDVLLERGIRADHIHFDRFITTADATPEPVRPVASAWDYAKFGLFHGIGLLSVATLLAGGGYTTLGMFGIIAMYVLGDAYGGEDTTTPEYTRPEVLTWLLWAALPLMVLIAFTSVWTMSTGDPLGFGAWVTAMSGYDVLAARAANGLGHTVSAFVVTGLMIGLVSTIPAHELTHRTWDRVSLTVGRAMLAFSFDTIFSIEHVYGHHRYVSTTHDPATAPRGRNVYAHVLISTVRGNVSAWDIEAQRLDRKRLGVWSVHNAWLRGHAISVALLAVAWAMGGLTAAAYFLACMLWGKALLEIVNYMEHYGIVRDPADPVMPRHSWNTNKRLSSWTMFNLTRHSHHHAAGEVPYGDLRPYPDAPMMIGGYLTTILVAMVPPLWQHLMTPKLLEWDARFATDKERRMAAEANAVSGVPGLVGRGIGGAAAAK
jgi:NAD(P)H-flavin reductase/ferredoxin